MDLQSRIFVAGHKGLVGSAIARKLQNDGFSNLLLKTRQELDLLNAGQVDAFFASQKPEYVFLAAAKVGGIHANNTFPADFIVENLAIQSNVITAAWRHRVKKLCFLGSSCIYPKMAPQPIREECFLEGKLEPTNAPYAIAKIAGVMMAQSFNRQYGTNFISVMPTNLYGPNDNFDLNNSHVLPALIRKFIEAKEQGQPEVSIWGSGNPRREFLHVDDLADACLFLMQKYDDGEIINVGTGEDVTIKELALLIGVLVGYKGKLNFDSSKPDGTPRKLLDVAKIHGLGWRSRIGLKEGVRMTIEWYLQHMADK